MEHFLKVIQASQLSSLVDIIDDELVGYIRRFLVESRIQEALEPLLDHLQEGGPPTPQEAQTAMREVSHVLRKAFQSAQKALPPGGADATTNGQPARRRRKR